MIKVDGKFINKENFTDRFPIDSLGYDIFNTLAESFYTYEYKKIAQLEFEVLLRREIIMASYSLHESNLSFRVFRQSFCNEKYWNRTFDGGFKLKSAVSSGEAIEDIYINGHLYGTECATAMPIVYYKALIQVYGKEKFDDIFDNIDLMNWHRLDSNLREIGNIRKVEEHLPGDRLYFNNPDVDFLNLYLQGENVIDLGKDLYYGHGFGIYPADVFVKILNQVRRENAKKSAYLMEEAARPNFNKLAGLK